MTGDKPLAETWFSIEAYPHRILRFREHNIDSYAVGDLWLILGSERDLLVDTGSGIVSPEPLISAVSGKTLTAVAMNPYYDHAGGWASFAERACHPLDAPALAAAMEENASFSVYLNEETLWARPHSSFSLETYHLQSAEPTRLIEDGDQFDLGGRRIEVLHLPGRSPGGLGLFEAATGSLFTSDMLYDGDHGPSWPPPDPGAYQQSLQRMRALPIEAVYPGHYGVMDRGRALAVIDAQLADLRST